MFAGKARGYRSGALFRKTFRVGFYSLAQKYLTRAKINKPKPIAK
jgi:hypothetical protein